MLAGIPLYVCATASVPIAASLILAGISPGAALVFLMAGPATNAATLSILWKLMGRATTLIYVGTVAVMSLLAGTVLDLIYEAKGVSAVPHEHVVIPHGVQVILAVLLLVVLLSARFRVGKNGA